MTGCKGFLSALNNVLTIAGSQLLKKTAGIFKAVAKKQRNTSMSENTCGCWYEKRKEARGLGAFERMQDLFCRFHKSHLEILVSNNPI